MDIWVGITLGILILEIQTDNLSDRFFPEIFSIEQNTINRAIFPRNFASPTLWNKGLVNLFSARGLKIVRNENGNMLE